MTLEDLALGPIFMGIVKTTGGEVFTDRQVVLASGFVYVETTTHGQTDVAAYPASQVTAIENLRPGPSTSYAYTA